jgi:DNA-binding beta-propeller fold protein YncE
MRPHKRTLVLALLPCALALARAQAPKPVVFSTQVLPLLRQNCMACHSGPSPSSGYSLETREKLLKGGRHGAAIVAGKSAQGTFLGYLTGAIKPQMPPGKPLDKETISVLRRWIDEGAVVDSFESKPIALLNGTPSATPAPVSAPAHVIHTPITALAYTLDGNLLAVAGYKSVALWDTKTGTQINTFSGCAGQVQSLAFSGDGKRLAVAGGVPGVSGEVLVFDLASSKVVAKVDRHKDVVQSVAFHPKENEILTASLDKTVKRWDLTANICLQTVKDHADTVLSVTYSPDGTLFATGSVDRTAKIFDTKTGKRLATLNGHNDSIVRVVFNADGTKLATLSSDKTMKLWTVKRGNIDNPDRTHYESEPFLSAAFSPDGQFFAYSLTNNRVKVWAGNTQDYKREWGDATDWPQALTFSPDSKTIATGTVDGHVLLWQLSDGKLLKSW